jgi:cyclohexyl-isocyanide hydratase
MRGYRATTHWLSLDLLPLVGAIPVQQRIVKDRDRLTGGGITAGMDFGFALVAEVAGQERAEAVQLMMEYDPAPPFRSGSPETADRALVERVTKQRAALQAERRKFFEQLGLAAGV